MQIIIHNVCLTLLDKVVKKGKKDKKTKKTVRQSGVRREGCGCFRAEGGPVKSVRAGGRGRGLVGRGSKAGWCVWQVPGYMRGGEGLRS